MKNIIILGPGRTGSSILSGIISRNRYYINLESIESRKAYPDGDYENPELVELNKKLYHAGGHKWDRLEPGQKIDLRALENLAKSDDIDEYKAFITKCNQHEPWLWKDPRLVFTMYFWKHLIDMKNVIFITISRDPYLIFRSHSKYQISFTKKQIYQRYQYEFDTMNQFIKKHRIDALNVDYREFWKKSQLLEKLNHHLDINVTEADYDSVVRKDIKKKKEGRYKFFLRYTLGASRLYFSSLLKNKKKADQFYDKK